MPKKKGRKGTSVKVEGHNVTRKGNTVFIKAHTRKKRSRKKVA